jgi:hypothetical protein
MFKMKSNTAFADILEDRTEYLKSGNNERILQQNISEQTFHIQGWNHSFKCVPDTTSNFDIFRFCNQLSIEEAKSVWEYYKEKFITAKLSNIPLTEFRETLFNFLIERQDIKRSTVDGFSTSSHKNATVILNKREYIEGVINLAMWLGLQYKVDTLLDKLTEDKPPVVIEKNFYNFTQQSVSGRSYVSYFFTKPEAEHTDIDNRKLHVKKQMDYNHKNHTTFVCDSNLGPVTLKVPNHASVNQTLPLLDRLLTQGTEIIICQGRIRSNIDHGVKYLHAEKWYIE